MPDEEKLNKSYIELTGEEPEGEILEVAGESWQGLAEGPELDVPTKEEQ